MLSAAAGAAAAGAGRRHMSSNQVGPGRAFIEGFAKSIRRQAKENKAMQENIKLLTAETSRLTDSESLKRAKQLMEEEGSAIKSQAAKRTEQVAKCVSETVAKAADSSIGRAASATIKSTAHAVGQATRPIAESKAYKKVSSDVSRALHDTSGRYGGFASIEQRDRLRALRAEAWANAKRHKCTPNYSATAVAYASASSSSSSKVQDKWERMKVDNLLLRGLFGATEALQKSDNLVVSWGRWLVHRTQDRFGSLLEETETARSLAVFKQRDPSFQIEDFLCDAREFIMPEVLTAWVAGNRSVLHRWCSTASYSVMTAGLPELEKNSLYNASLILELQNMEMVSAKLLDNNVPAIVISFQTQETLVYRDCKTHKIALGSEGHVHLCSYVVVFTLEEDSDDDITHGWKIIDQAKHSAGSAL